MANQKSKASKALRKFMYKHCITCPELAEIINLKNKQAWNIKYGRCTPSLDTAWRIEQLTDGLVSVTDWIEDRSLRCINKYKERRYTEAQKKEIRRTKHLTA